ncbi:GNAT family N-acetyltransferase [Haloarchaeobius iranensis]|uniref:Ribosomal protein S18 acetylase RimI n=1 Tax=Haloarchaeobius iranensis TaxID=996166 RepID=A0A1H0AS24_9EURY|nr:N-acetyltransferase [Haloarchaeobius iranensis]SDN36310.1 Ribosomal protein S18 acetylase RimI [Haloarchaeobius iranensis]
MKFRHATTDDVPEILRVAERSWEHDYPDILTRESAREAVHEWYDADRLELDAVTADTALVVAIDEAADEDVAGPVVGFVHGVVDDDTGTLLRVYVDPDYRGAGTGRALVEYAMDDFGTRGVERVEAMVLVANEPGNEFYESLGFELVQRATTTIAGEPYDENIYLKLL